MKINNNTVNYILLYIMKNFIDTKKRNKLCIFYTITREEIEKFHLEIEKNKNINKDVSENILIIFYKHLNPINDTIYDSSLASKDEFSFNFTKFKKELISLFDTYDKQKIENIKEN